MLSSRKYLTASAIFVLLTFSHALDLNIKDEGSIKEASKTIVRGLLDSYSPDTPGATVGVIDERSYWWLSGALWGALVDYWYYTGDVQHNDLVREALQAQVGENKDFMPVNQTRNEGNDDQGIWALAALSAAEKGFPPPRPEQRQWLELAQAVFEAQVRRWDVDMCGGGLRWQIFSFNRGYNYKNAASQGAFFQLAARLARFTGNGTYAEWADKVWDWTERVELMKDFKVFDGTDTTMNCSNVNSIQWSSNVGLYLYGSAVMYNYTNGDERWKKRTEGLLDSSGIFFSPDAKDVMYEVACEPGGKCNTDQRAYKAQLARFMGATTQVAPFTSEAITKRLQASAEGAAKACAGKEVEASSFKCGTQWTKADGDGGEGPSDELSALEVIQANLVGGAKPLAKADTTGTTGTPRPAPGAPGSASSSAGGAAPTGAAGRSPVPLTLAFSLFVYICLCLSS
ncbi:MAG: hydrolase 76 protein [Thelocarpon impressellum]|nr:MAG: hydrolase 76 protein [Thelocarpon impressellum]